MNKDQECLLGAYEIALNSPDKHTKNGAVIYSATKLRIGEGSNTFPRLIRNRLDRLERPAKYNWLEHAERNAIFDAVRNGFGNSLHGSVMYCPWFACADCARAIIAVGISKVIGDKKMFEFTPDHWKDSIDTAFLMLAEAGVQTSKIEIPHIQTVYNERPWSPYIGYMN